MSFKKLRNKYIFYSAPKPSFFFIFRPAWYLSVSVSWLCRIGRATTLRKVRQVTSVEKKRKTNASASHKSTDLLSPALLCVVSKMLFVMRLKKRIMFFFFCLFDLAGISRQSVSEILQLKLKIGRKKSAVRNFDTGIVLLALETSRHWRRSLKNNRKRANIILPNWFWGPTPTFLSINCNFC